MDVNVKMEVHQLSASFTADYPVEKYPELMYKQTRPYSCLTIDTDTNYYICIPYRTNILHNNAFKFRGTKRSQSHTSGLDYSKIVLVQKTTYFDSQGAHVDQDEYNETRKNIKKISTDAIRYVNGYINHHNGTKVLHPKEYARKYQYSTLKYFHNILNLK